MALRLLFLLFTAASASLNCTTTLRNGQELPLVGFGVGNLAHSVLTAKVTEAMRAGYRLIDTAQASRNAELIRKGMGKLRKDVHIVTKIWYTYLGYGRTQLAINEILQDYPHAQLHILLHWPRCREDIPWMNCEKEEEELPEHVKQASPPPHLNKDTAYIASWNALEEAYEQHEQIVSIGVSNFGVDDMLHLSSAPHILQDNVWNLAFNPHIHEYCRTNGIHYQVYNVMNGILGQQPKAPQAYLALGGSKGLLQWLVSQGMSVIPRTSHHIQENSPAEICTDFDGEDRLAAVQALLRGQDLEQPVAVFVNDHDEISHIYWQDFENKKIPVATLEPGESFSTKTYSGHKFSVVSGSKSREYQVSAQHGEQDEFRIEL